MKLVDGRRSGWHLRRMERPLEDTTDLFVGRTITEVDASACNNVIFTFDDGGKVALHIEVDQLGLPDVQTCTSCV